MRRIYCLISLAITLLGLALLVMQSPVVSVVGNLSLDMFQRTAPRQYSPAPVRIVDIDEQSLDLHGQWPWPRSVTAQLVSRLTAMGAAAVVFDMVFSEPDRTSPENYVQLYRNDPILSHLLREKPSHDSILARAFAEGRVVTGFSITSDTSKGGEPERKSRFITAGDDPKQFLHSFTSAVVNLPELEQASLGNGAFNFHADYDGVVRAVPMVVVINDKLYPSLAAEALRVAQGATNVVVKSSGASGESRSGGKTGIVAVQIGNLPVDTGPGGEVWLHYSPSVPERYVPAHAVLGGTAEQEKINGHIVLVGSSAKGLFDLRFSPLGGTIPGVEMHAQLLESLIQESYLHKPDWAKAVSVIILLAGWVVAVLASRFRAVWMIGIAATSLGLLWWGAWEAYLTFHLIVDPLFPSIFLTAGYTACGIGRFTQAERERHWIRDAFARYISPNLVAYLMENPQHLELGGENRECSFVLTDIAGFTTFMENNDPEEVSAQLNDYIDGMIEIAFRHDATLSSIVGDALALMFSAPVVQEDHADRAVRCAMEMDRFARQFSATCTSTGCNWGDTRIGVHTGTVMIGNFGGKSMFEYRALGDPINTCSRLETVNKHIGTLVMVSDETVQQCRTFHGRPAGELLLKGKSEPVLGYEPLSEEEAASERVVQYRTAYEQMADESEAAIESFARLVQQYPNDPLIRYHHDRLQRGERGVKVVFDTK